MQTPFGINSKNAYYEFLEYSPEGAKQIVGSKMSEEKLGVVDRNPVYELRTLCGLFEGYKQTGESVFISKAEEYLTVWSRAYNPDTSEKGIQISLDQRYFSWVFIETLDCWGALSEEGKEAVITLTRKVVSEEEKFWVSNNKHNNRYSYSNLTRMTAYGVLKHAGDNEASTRFEVVVGDFFNQVRENVYTDGSTSDYKERDSVHYQVFNQIAWEVSRKYLIEHSIPIPEDVQSKLEASLKFCLKYISGEEIHLEFVKSTHQRDQQIQGDKVGKPFDKYSSSVKQLLQIIEK